MLKSENLNINKKDGLVYISFPKLDREPYVVAAFSTRLGGVSEGKYSTMNLSFSNGDDARNVTENYNRFFKAVGLDPKRAVFSKQTHTKNIKIVTKNDIGKGYLTPVDYTDVDGLITNIKGVSLVTHYADCVPLLFYDKENGVIAASHSGWRGTVQKIGAETVSKMSEHFGSDPKNIICAIGPCIGKCCYEVDGPVFRGIDSIDTVDSKSVLTEKSDGHYMLDLVNTNRQILIGAGILPENIDCSDICTCCNSEFLHSHRATNGERGINAAVISLL